MKKIVFGVFALALLSGVAVANEGETIYKTKCMACHTIGEGKRVGPDLKGITKKRTAKWLKEFIEYPEGMIMEKKDPEAVKLFAEYKTMMPEPELNAKQIEAVLKYIESKSK